MLMVNLIAICESQHRIKADDSFPPASNLKISHQAPFLAIDGICEESGAWRSRRQLTLTRLVGRVFTLVPLPGRT